MAKPRRRKLLPEGTNLSHRRRCNLLGNQPALGSHLDVAFEEEREAFFVGVECSFRAERFIRRAVEGGVCFEKFGTHGEWVVVICE